MVEIEGVEFSGFLDASEAVKEYNTTPEKIDFLVSKGALKTYCTPSNKKVFSQKDLDRELKSRG